MYNLKTAPGAERDIRRIGSRVSREDIEHLRKAITNLAGEPRPKGVKKIKGRKMSYRIRVGNYRVVYEVYDNDKLVLILQIIRRSETTYRQ